MTDRRSSVPFDPDYFARRAESGGALQPLEAFRHAWRSNHWSGPESQSGQGSSLDQTARIREALPDLCRRLGIGSLLDLPCGDCHWITQVALPDVWYTGGDLVPEIVERNIARFGEPRRRFMRLDLTASQLPAADLLLCRDGLVHLSVRDIAAAVRNIRRSDIHYLLTTTFTSEPANRDITTGDWRPLNLELPPFQFPSPLELLNEGCTEQEGRFADKSLALWRIVDLPSD